jgi:hypothetical protein
MEVDEGMAKRDAWVNRIEAATKSSVRGPDAREEGGRAPGEGVVVVVVVAAAGGAGAAAWAISDLGSF